MRRRNRITEAGLAAVLVAGLTGALTACGSDGRVVAGEAAADQNVYPVVAPGQARSVLDAVQATLVRGVSAKDTPATADPRLRGPYLQAVLAQARIAAGRKITPAVPSQLQGQRRLIIPLSSSWPRFFIAVGDSSTSALPLLRVLSSASARAPYGLWAEATMLPGATLPPTAPDSVGSPLVAPNAGGLVETPQEVLTGFAGYLNRQARTTTSKQFRRSVYSDQLLQWLAAQRKGLKAVATVSNRHTVAPVAPLGVRTSDGGALVVGEFYETYLIKIKKGKGTVRIDKNLSALAGGATKISKSLTKTAVEVVVFNVPPSGKGFITVVAAQKSDIKAVIK